MNKCVKINYMHVRGILHVKWLLSLNIELQSWCTKEASHYPLTSFILTHQGLSQLFSKK